MDAALNLHGIRVKALVGMGVADFADHTSCNPGIIHIRLRGDLSADDAEISGNHGLARYPGVGILRKAGIQNGVGNCVRHLIGMSGCYTFGSKKSGVHFSVSFLFGEVPRNKEKPHTEDPMCVKKIRSSSFVAAGFCTLYKQVAGFHRAVPSTTLDKACMQFSGNIVSSHFLFVKSIVHNSSMDFLPAS